MAKRTIKIQAGLPIELHEQFMLYRESEKLGESAAAVKLIELALRVISNSESDSISNRELMELLLLQSNKTLLITKKLLKGNIEDTDVEREKYILFNDADKTLMSVAESATDQQLSS